MTENTKPIVPFSEWLQEELKISGMTQMDLAVETGMSQGQVCRYATGKMIPKIPTVQRILDVFGEQLAVVSRK